jgi:hypothetical protein
MRSLALAIGIAILVIPGWAVAKPKVALVAFDGDKKGEAREAVSDSIGDDVTVMGSKQVNRTIDNLGFDPAALGDKDLRKLTKELDVDAIIQAELSTKGKNKVLHFKLFVHGKKVKGFKVEFGSLKSAKFKAKLKDKLLEKLGFAPPPGDDDTPILTTSKTKKKPAAGDDDDATPTTTKKLPAGDDAAALKTKHTGDDDDAAPVKKKPAGDDDDAAPHPKHVAQAGGDDDAEVTAHVVVPLHDAGEHTPNRDAVRVDLGPSGSQRSLSFNSRSFDQAPAGYKNSFVPGFRVEGEIYPLAFGNPNGIAAGLGLGGLYDQTASLSLTSSIQEGSKFPVTERRYSIGPKIRIMFGHTATSPSVVVGVGYGHRTFTVNTSALMPGNSIDLPNVDYRGFDPNLEFRIPLTPRLAISFGGGAILLRGAGAIQTLAEYGQAKITGGEGNIGFDILFSPRIGVRLQADAAQLGYKFTGNGEMTNDRDGDPSSQDVGGAADRYIGAAATLAVIY